MCHLYSCKWLERKQPQFCVSFKSLKMTLKFHLISRNPFLYVYIFDTSNSQVGIGKVYLVITFCFFWKFFNRQFEKSAILGTLTFWVQPLYILHNLKLYRSEYIDIVHLGAAAYRQLQYNLKVYVHYSLMVCEHLEKESEKYALRKVLLSIIYLARKL